MDLQKTANFLIVMLSFRDPFFIQTHY